MDPIKTGQIIVNARKKLNMTQKELAQQLSITDKAVSKWERGLCLPDISILLPLSQILKTNLYELLKGEKIEKEELEDLLKDTIEYSNKEIKRHKYRYFVVSAIIVIIIILMSLFFVKTMYNYDRGGLTDRDTLHDISYYTDYKSSADESKNYMRFLEVELPLSWSRESVAINESGFEVKYFDSYKDTIIAYNDERYVKRAMIDISIITFITIDEIESVSINFEDCKFTVFKDDIKKIFAINDFAELEDAENFKSVVSEKLTQKEFVSESFENLFSKENLNN